MVACLWAGDDAAASHETALAVHGLTDAMPAQIHVTTPRRFRGERPGVIIHTAPLSDEYRVSREGVPVTTVARAIADVTERSGPLVATQAAAEAIDRGLMTWRELRQALADGGHDRQAILLLTLNEEGL